MLREIKYTNALSKSLNAFLLETWKLWTKLKAFNLNQAGFGNISQQFFPTSNTAENGLNSFQPADYNKIDCCHWMLFHLMQLSSAFTSKLPKPMSNEVWKSKSFFFQGGGEPAFSSTSTGLTPKKGREAQPGFIAHAPGSPEMTIEPVSVCTGACFFKVATCLCN